MKLKRFALKALVILAVTVAVCMFFARTVQTITTPKVRLLTPTTGRLDRKLSLHAEVWYESTEEMVIDEAASHAITVGKVRVRTGQHVSEGDVIFTATLGSYSTDMDKFRSDYMEKATELATKDTANRKKSKQSRQNELYEDMLDAQETAATAKIDARVAASAAGIKLNNDVSDWKKQLGVLTEVPEDIMSLVNKAIAANTAYNTANEAYLAVLEDKKMRVDDDVFDYIRERTQLLKDMDDLLDQMVELAETAAALETIAAPRDGWIISVDVTAGSEYNGSAAAYKLTGENVQPVLRAQLEDGDRTVIEKGTKATLQVGEQTYSSQVTDVVTQQGKRYALLEMPEELTSSTTAYRDALANGIDTTVNWRATQRTTLIPASCIRTEGTEKYVLVAEKQYGGFLQSDSLKLTRQTVTVEGQNDKYVSISEDLTYQQIAYQEDRAVQDGSTVMEYLN